MVKFPPWRSRFLDVTQRSPQKALRDIQKTAAKETNNEAGDLSMSSSSEQMTAG